MLDVQNRYCRAENNAHVRAPSVLDWGREQIALQYGRFIYWCPAFLSCGIGVYFLLGQEPPVILPVFALLLSLAILAMISGNQSRILSLRLVFALALLPALGFMAAKIHQIRVHAPIISEELGPVTVSGRVEQIEMMKPDYDARILLSNVAVEDLAPDMTPHKVRLRLRSDAGIQVGDRISALAELMPPSGPLLPGGFNFRKHLYFQGIGAVGFIYTNVQILESGNKGGFFSQVEAMRHAITAKVYAALPDEERAGVATALMNGMRAGITDADRDALRDAGLAHLLAISGLHVGLVCGALFFFARLLMASAGNFALYHPVKKYAALFAMAGGLIYMFLAGATVPTQRAMLMSSVVFCAIILDRSPISLRLVVFAALIVLIISPYSLLSASFQLSFAAVTALVAFYEWIRPRLIAWRRNMNGIQRAGFYFISIAMTSVIAGLATAPFSLYHFQHFATYNVLANMIAIPIMAFWVMPSAIISMVLMPLNLETLPLQFMGLGIAQITDAAHYVAGLEGAVWRLHAFSFWIFLAMSCGLVFMILWKGPLCYLGGFISAIAFLYIFFEKQPSILVSESSDLIALTQPKEQFRVNTLRREKFTRENWEQSFGLEKDTAALIGKIAPDHCDDLGCRTIINDRKLAISMSSYAHLEDCSWADLLISREPVFIPCAAKVIDRFDVHRNGMHAVYFSDDKEMRILTNKDMLSWQRPWNAE
ncbi:MAG: ComEC/Rec2 family competence protein [Alphaproteobacteria bacterium]